MRISTGQVQQRAVDRMLEQQVQLSHTQQQVATGKQFLTPADDPSAAVKAMGLEREISLTQQYQKNAALANDRQVREEDALASVTSLLQRVSELVVQGNNDTYSADDRHAIATELQQRLDELLGLANTRDANGEYLFSGFQGNTQPFSHDGSGIFTYNGDQGQRFLNIGPGVQVAMTDSGAEVFQRIQVGGNVQDVFTTVYKLADAFANAADDPASRADLHTSVDNGLEELDAALQHVLQVRTRVGARLNTVESQKDYNDAFLLSVQETLSGVQDLDYAEAVSRLQLQLTSLQASQQSFLKIQGLSLFNYL
jgi:flagellar hook-associated protein 3 FlgL